MISRYWFCGSIAVNSSTGRTGGGLGAKYPLRAFTIRLSSWVRSEIVRHVPSRFWLVGV